MLFSWLERGTEGETEGIGDGGDGIRPRGAPLPDGETTSGGVGCEDWGAWVLYPGRARDRVGLDSASSLGAGVVEGWTVIGFELRLVFLRAVSVMIILELEVGFDSGGTAEDDEVSFTGPGGVTSVGGIGAL